MGTLLNDQSNKNVLNDYHGNADVLATPASGSHL
ncbi:hypothetical protein COLAER_02356 [Collinsella aerofaciens ATCC 25986]|uniref:Uncharacterized protein n=1 Tax=Collinsella aerofaciens (strain ATCC 25986 / DSM 3979 / JCM 10188 / KCTC 3647 / NCTC 11838 / VPI 1003) TaxID=411903 RepID=A4ED15_COLAA|nr:hypothetical protein COLAER_02356 [Collinsella aerofaciens ATCC 25986]